METCFYQEKRRKQREMIEFPLKIIASNDGSFGNIEIPGKAFDVSEKGIGLQTVQPLPINKYIICIVNMGEKEDPECLIGWIVWCLTDKNGFRYGMQLRQKRIDFINKLKIRFKNYKKPIRINDQNISDESILQVAEYLNASSIELNQIKMLNNQYVHKLNREQVWISDVINIDEYSYEIDELRSCTVFYTYANPNLKCPVCFDHILDHYPMMSLFEITRQMGLAIMHQFYHVPMQGYISIVQKLSFDYRYFAELDLPLVVFLVDTCEPKFVDKVQDRTVELFFVQENVLCAHVLGEMSAIKTKTYSRIRKSARRNKLKRRSDKIDENKIATNVDVAPLFTSRNALLYK